MPEEEIRLTPVFPKLTIEWIKPTSGLVRVKNIPADCFIRSIIDFVRVYCFCIIVTKI